MCLYVLLKVHTTSVISFRSLDPKQQVDRWVPSSTENGLTPWVTCSPTYWEFPGPRELTLLISQPAPSLLQPAPMDGVDYCLCSYIALLRLTRLRGLVYRTAMPFKPLNVGLDRSGRPSEISGKFSFPSQQHSGCTLDGVRNILHSVPVQCTSYDVWIYWIYTLRHNSTLLPVAEFTRVSRITRTRA